MPLSLPRATLALSSLALGAALLFSGPAASAQSSLADGVYTPGTAVTLADPILDSYRAGGGVTERTLTQSVSQDVTRVVACSPGQPTPRISFFRAFDLDEQGVNGPLTVDGFSMGVAFTSAGDGSGTQTVNIKLHKLTDPNGEVTRSNLSLMAGTSVPVDDVGDPGTVYTYEISDGPTFEPSDVLVFEVEAPDGRGDGTAFGIGTNAAGESGPTYIESASCGPGFPNIIPVSDVLADQHWVLNVFGTQSVEVYAAEGLPLAIPDNAPDAGLTSTLVVPAEAASIERLDVFVDIEHTWVGDLTATLTRDGVSSTLFQRPGTPATAAGCSGNDMSIVLSDLDLDGPVDTECESGPDPAPAYPNGGFFTPTTPLSVFDNTPAAGTWTFNITDSGNQDTGTLLQWSLLVRPSTSVASEIGAGGVLSTLTVAPNPIAGSAQISLTVGEAQDVRVAMYDALGREVRVLSDRAAVAGQQSYISVNTSGLASGVYVIRASGPSLSLTERVTVLR